MISAALAMIRDDSDREFVKDLFNAHEQMLFKIAFNILHNKTDAEDVVQNTVVKIIDNLEKIRIIDSDETKFYLITMVKNAAIDMRRKLKRLPESNRMKELGELEADCSVEDTALLKISSDKVNSALLSLKNDEYEILFLYLIMGYSPHELARYFGISTNNARQRVYHAKQNLKKILEKEGVTNDI